jgi:hypothetical protein
MKARRTAEEQTLLMERAYVEAESGKTICCWEAVDRPSLEGLFARAGVHFESMSPVAEILEVDLR